MLKIGMTGKKEIDVSNVNAMGDIVAWTVECTRTIYPSRNKRLHGAHSTTHEYFPISVMSIEDASANEIYSIVVNLVDSMRHKPWLARSTVRWLVMFHVSHSECHIVHIVLFKCRHCMRSRFGSNFICVKNNVSFQLVRVHLFIVAVVVIELSFAATFMNTFQWFAFIAERRISARV